MDDTKLLFVIASRGFQLAEYAIPKKIIEEAGFTVITASDKSGPAIAHDGTPIAVDITLDRLYHPLPYAGIVFVGGPGALDLLDTHTNYKLIQIAIQHNIPVGALCIAPRILAKAGVLHGKQATGWNGDDSLAQLYHEYQINYDTTHDVVIDDNIITATGPSAAHQFATELVHMLQKKQSWG